MLRRKRVYVIEQVDTPETIELLTSLVVEGHFDIRQGVSIDRMTDDL